MYAESRGIISAAVDEEKLTMPPPSLILRAAYWQATRVHFMSRMRSNSSSWLM